MCWIFEDTYRRHSLQNMALIFHVFVLMFWSSFIKRDICERVEGDLSRINTLSNPRHLPDHSEILGKLLASIDNKINNMKSKCDNLENKMISKINDLETELKMRNKTTEQMLSKLECLARKLHTVEIGLETGRNGKGKGNSCFDLLTSFECDGVYELSNGLNVYCDQTTDGGGWTVFQRRRDGSVDFERKWADYKRGFGNLAGEFWLGNKNIQTLTATGNHELRIDMEDFEGNKAYAKYSTFKIKSEAENYALEIDGYNGNAGDSLSYHNKQKFSTIDRDNDVSGWSCSETYRGAWWYSLCHTSNLNGFYYNGPECPYGKGIVWYHWKYTYNYTLKSVEMKLRPYL